MVKFIIFSILFFGLSFGAVNRTNYIYYHEKFSEIEADIVSERFEKAQAEIEKLFEKYEVKFVKDYVIAAQVALLNKDKKNALIWLREAIKNGASLGCLKEIKIIQNQIPPIDWKELMKEYDALRKGYLSKIDLVQLNSFSKRYTEEQKGKRTQFYAEIVRLNFDSIHHYIKLKKYPSDRFIGIDNGRLSPSIAECDFGNAKVIVTLLHYDYPISEIGESRLVDLIKSGDLHPRDFANIYAFQENKISVLYRKSNKELILENEYKFNFPFGKKHENIRRVNMDRALFGICKYEVDQKKEAIEQEYGMKLRFGYR